ncbi:DUF6499 domain-containing protein [Aureimonas altamirensis]|uniref:transcriptional regulator domain-containing protein n=1 Tax=Aureimonas altamirensis TaxID=370622 RepID=UPI002036BF47|nr:DUF6499 domain-containing protein [Aureimonas altamirensis]MCM2505536.1 DUF6499 domain-containing protein [Aureimonas altamirensis]
MLSIDWRAPAAYRHANKIVAAGLAWEYLRRHGGYRDDFQSITRIARPDAEQLDSFVQRWGLRFPARSRCAF